MYNSKALLSAVALAGASLAQTTASSVDAAACSSSLTFFREAPTPAPALYPYLAPLLSGPQTVPGQTTALPDVTLEDPKGYQELLCAVAAELPTSLLPDFRDFGSALLSYGSAHSSKYDAYITECITTGEAASTLISELHEMFTGTGGLCQPTASASATTGAASVTPAPGSGVSNGTYPTGTGSLPTPTGGSSSSTLVPTAAAARPTGALVGAAAIGGLLGAIAML
ncbi:hypothetical protein SAMD00023353_1501940 [Rosellinia necatrix]|uniref:Uncharacterized protein n=1 Tax=Rosellinia necatrix TaxID=77044 RepID=A0A1W2TRI0_ROSNE|nr:hypothetical protein SAMD00023353_1501940 [Rosellinia necatrix]